MATQTDLRRALVTRVGGLSIATTTDVAAAPDPTRWIYARGATAGLTTWRADLGNPLRWAGLWVAVLSGDQITAIRQITDAEPENGGIEVDAPFAAAIASGVSVEVTGPLPLARQQTVQGWREALNLGLGHLKLGRRITASIAVNGEISLSQSWLDRPSRILRIWEPSSVASGGSLKLSRRPWTFIRSGETTLLKTRVLPGTATGDYTLDVLAPASSWIKQSGGSYQEDADGLTAEGDEAAPPTSDVVDASLVFAYLFLSNAAPDPETRDRYRALHEQQLAYARTLEAWDHTRDRLLPRPETVPVDAAPSWMGEAA